MRIFTPRFCCCSSLPALQSIKTMTRASRDSRPQSVSEGMFMSKTKYFHSSSVYRNASYNLDIRTKLEKKQTPRRYDSGCRNASGQPVDYSKVSKEWRGSVAKFGNLRIETNIKTRVIPIDPIDVPNGDQAIVMLSGMIDNSNSDEIDTLLSRAITVDADQGRFEVLWLKEHKFQDTLELCIKIPFPYDVHGTQHSYYPFHIEKLENDTIAVDSQAGDIIFRNLKSNHVKLQTGGQIKADGYLLGNAQLQCHGSGSMDVRKLQGSQMLLSSEDGDISATAIYSQATKVISKNGGISLLSSHGNLKCKTGTGVVQLASVSGTANIATETGDILATLDRTDHLSAETNCGNITLRIPPKADVRILSSGKKIKLNPELRLTESRLDNINANMKFVGKCGDGKGLVQLHTTIGSIEIATKDWLSSIKGFEHLMS